MKKALAALILAHATLALSVAATHRLLPDRVATHFGPDGQPDGWASRSDYATYLLSSAALISILCAGPLYLTRKLPESLINIPERDYWLAPERRDEAHARLFALGLGIAAATTGLFVALHLLTVRANLARPPRLATAEAFGLVATFLAILGGVFWAFGPRAWRVEDRS
ncbi:DUF1648 domain-containing protein [Paludisphaera sp.]|uniref:DUF1648 domain-containing protein n=1 Tax=Paludisphaera sp. TaxID=2017432 RepID=UPI00301C7033